LEKEEAELLTPDSDFIQRCLEDIPALCAYIEKQLGLEGVATDKSPATGVGQCPLLLGFPMPWDDGACQAEQIPDLLAELRSQNYAEDPALLRALDNFIRVANWANKLNFGIFLSDNKNFRG
jgi:hypothetical protein